MKHTDALSTANSPEARAARLCYTSTPGQRSTLSRALVAWERRHGPADTSRRYTSHIPAPQQQWLFDREFEVWFAGLPPFVREYFEELVGDELAPDRALEGAVRRFFSAGVQAPPTPVRSR